MKGREAAGKPAARQKRGGAPFFQAQRGRAGGRPPFFQAKLTIGPAGDAFEQEADRVAEAVVSSGTAPMVQRASAPKSSQPATGVAPRGLAREVTSLGGSGQRLPDRSRSFFEGSFGVGFEDVRVHADDRAARLAGSVDARAFTHGRDIVFGRGEYRPGSTEGRKLLAHELTHVVQQRGAAPGSLIQRRRVPGTGDVLDLVWRENAAAHAAGLHEIVRRAWEELTVAQKLAVMRREMRTGTPAERAARSQLHRDIFRAHLIRQEVPDLRLGDPTLYQVGARPSTADAANITTLVGGANTIFAAIAAGTHDASITQVFGSAHLATAKARYANARTRMNYLHGRDKILTDRSGFTSEVSIGGGSTDAKIMVAPRKIDNPTAKGSIVTMIHEAMHAGNYRVVRDRGYIHRGDFTRMAATRKLGNAAHFEVVPRRILGTSRFTFTGQTFTPAGGTTSSGVVTPTLTSREQAVDAAAETFRKAWSAAANLYNVFLAAYRTPTDWNVDVSGRYNGAAPGTRFADCLPFWSKVEMLTVHRKTNIDPTSADVSRHPVSLIDIALSEGLIRKLHHGMRRTPQTAAAALALETAHATTAQRTAAAASVAAETSLILRLVLQHRIGRVTGGTSRDVRVVRRLAQASAGFSDTIVSRPPSAFP